MQTGSLGSAASALEYRLFLSVIEMSTLDTEIPAAMPNAVLNFTSLPASNSASEYGIVTTTVTKNLVSGSATTGFIDALVSVGNANSKPWLHSTVKVLPDVA